MFPFGSVLTLYEIRKRRPPTYSLSGLRQPQLSMQKPAHMAHTPNDSCQLLFSLPRSQFDREIEHPLRVLPAVSDAKVVIKNKTAKDFFGFYLSMSF